MFKVDGGRRWRVRVYSHSSRLVDSWARVNTLTLSRHGFQRLNSSIVSIETCNLKGTERKIFWLLQKLPKKQWTRWRRISETLDLTVGERRLVGTVLHSTSVILLSKRSRGLKKQQHALHLNRHFCGRHRFHKMCLLVSLRFWSPYLWPMLAIECVSTMWKTRLWLSFSEQKKKKKNHFAKQKLHLTFVTSCQLLLSLWWRVCFVPCGGVFQLASSGCSLLRHFCISVCGCGGGCFCEIFLAQLYVFNKWDHLHEPTFAFVNGGLYQMIICRLVGALLVVLSSDNLEKFPPFSIRSGAFHVIFCASHFSPKWTSQFGVMFLRVACFVKMDFGWIIPFPCSNSEFSLFYKALLVPKCFDMDSSCCWHGYQLGVFNVSAIEGTNVNLAFLGRHFCERTFESACSCGRCPVNQMQRTSDV